MPKALTPASSSHYSSPLTPKGGDSLIYVIPAGVPVISKESIPFLSFRRSMSD